ncbi:MAG: hypothetical protein B7Z02_18125 [Rhodobacterales bacterium 32-67-9]|nr:MAG: hypothetical protein B7Z02_18125 [Rhodobacterales bacterium 32-67-9]
MGFLFRWLAALGLLALTYNPTGLSYAHWAQAGFADRKSLVVLAGLVLFAAYAVYLRATLRSIGALGMILVAALVAALLWVLYDWGWLALDNGALNQWLGILALSVILGVGLSWSIIRQAISGQADVDDSDS